MRGFYQKVGINSGWMAISAPSGVSYGPRRGGLEGGGLSVFGLAVVPLWCSVRLPLNLLRLFLPADQGLTHRLPLQRDCGVCDRMVLLRSTMRQRHAKRPLVLPAASIPQRTGGSLTFAKFRRLTRGKQLTKHAFILLEVQHNHVSFVGCCGECV